MTRQFTSSVAGPFARGLEFGQANATQVSTTVADYLRLFACTGQDRSAATLAGYVDRLGMEALERIEGWAPELAEEIRGIAAGSGVAVERIAAINARTEVLAALSGEAAECSTVVTVGSGSPVAMQNWDWYLAMANNWLQWTIPHPDGRRVTTVTEYGIVGKIGINGHGLGTLFNILHHRDDAAGAVGVPVHVIARRILDTAVDVAAAVRTCESASASGLSASTSITIVDRDTAAIAELWPGGVGRVYPDGDGLLVRTNHFLSAPASTGDASHDADSDTVARYTYLRERLGPRAAVLDRPQMFAALSDDSSGVCCHPVPDEEPVLRHATLATVTLDPSRATLQVSDGSPCRVAQTSTVDRFG